jgi:hypothetical protein
LYGGYDFFFVYFLGFGVVLFVGLGYDVGGREGSFPQYFLVFFILFYLQVI